MKLHPMWQNYPELSKELAATLDLMEGSIKLKNKPVQKALLEMIRSGGKLLRPAFQLLFSQFGEERDTDKAIALAAAIEMLHNATLMHDDIVDRSNLRRGHSTVNAVFGNEVAVYAGDYLFVCCFKLMANYADSMRSLQLNSRSMEKILSGEMGQMDSRYNSELSTAEYLENISGKTAELFALSCSIGAYEAGKSEDFSKKCARIGKNIGMAFQIVDDILDYTEDAEQIGKPVLEDVRQGVYSLPLISALAKNRDAFLPYLDKKENMTTDDAQTVYQLVHQYQGVQAAQEIAAKYTNEALKDIRSLPDNPAHTKKTLEAITAAILVRKN